VVIWILIGKKKKKLKTNFTNHHFNSKPFLKPELTNINNRNTNRSGTNNTTIRRRGVFE